MKKSSLLILFFASMALNAANAGEIIAGGSARHSLHCEAMDHLPGRVYRVVIETKALAPKYDVVGCSLITTTASGGQTHSERLTEIKQSVTHASFTGNNELSVEYDKSSDTAEVYFGSKHALSCR
jgi:hypothetical protein